LGVLSCKDFKSWESKYADQVIIKFEQEKDKYIPSKLRWLHSAKLKNEKFICKLPVLKRNPAKNQSAQPGAPTEELDTILVKENKLDLDPTANSVHFVVYNDHYYHKVIIDYERIISLISPKAGGWQIQYLIKNVRFNTENNGRKPIFKEVWNPAQSIESKNAEDKTNHNKKINVITIYY
jgi:hypothetical protein